MDDIDALAALARSVAEALLDGDPPPARATLALHRRDLEGALAGTTNAEAAVDLAVALALDDEGRDGAGAERVVGTAFALARTGSQRARLHTARARSRYLHGRFAAAAEDGAAAVLARGDLGERVGRHALLIGSVTDRDTGQSARARRRASEVRGAALAHRDEGTAIWADLHEASAALLCGDVAPARGTYLGVLAGARGRGMRRVEALALTNLAVCDMALGELAAADHGFSEAIAAFEAIAEPLIANKLAVWSAKVALGRGRAGEAAARAARAEPLARQLDDRDTVVRAGLVLAKARTMEALALAQANGFSTALSEPEPRRGGARPLRVAEDGSLFAPPGGRTIDLRTRGPLRRVLAHLVACRTAQGGAPAATEALVAAGWPREQILPEAARDRVYSAVRMLRRLGLEGLLARVDGGYLLDPSVPVEVSAPWSAARD